MAASSMKPGVYRRIWVTSKGVRSRVYIVRGDRVFDLQRAEWIAVRFWDGLPGVWEYLREHNDAG